MGDAHWAAIVTVGYDRLQAIDLGPINATLPLITSLVSNDESADPAATTLFEQLIEPLNIDKAEHVILAPDGALNLLPFHRLQQSDGRMWIETTELRMVQSGRDLLRPKHDRPASGLLALGGIDFDGSPIQMAAIDSQSLQVGHNE